MSTLTRYILKEMLGPTTLGLLFYTSIILMQQLFAMAGMIISRSLSAATVGKLLLFSLPNIVVLTLPMSLLFGILIAVGRLSSDSEVVAMRALGISMRTIYRPVFLFSLAVFLLNLYLINFVMPEGNRQFVALRSELLTSTAEKAIRPRIFHDQFDNLMIYVDDIDSATGEWKGVFVADSRGNTRAQPVTPQEMAEHIASQDEPQNLGGFSSGAQRVILAERGNLAVVQPTRDVWMNLGSAETHVWSPRRPEKYDLTRNEAQRLLLPTSGGNVDSVSVARSLREMNLRQLVDQERSLRASHDVSDRVTRNLAKVEIHKKFAFPFACIAFGIFGLPLGITNRRGGKSSGFSLSIAIILLYYVMIENGEQLAANGRIPAWLGMWAANILLLLGGIFLLARANRDVAAQRSEGGIVQRLAGAVTRRFSRRPKGPVEGEEPSLLSRLDITFPNILDRYVLVEFLKVLSLVIVSVVALFMVIEYTETAGDARENDVPITVLLTYLRFHVFGVMNWALPISVLVATLVTFALLSKNNEVTAMKANGVSLYRIGFPVVAIAVVISFLAYFLLDFVVPYSAKRAEELKRVIKGRPAVATTAEQKLWFLGKGRYIINFLAYDRNAQRLTQVQVFELHPDEFRLSRRVFARHATWNGDAWVFENGWIRSFTDGGDSTYSEIRSPLALQYRETPEDFATEYKPPEQMTFAQLRRYIAALEEAGYAAERLTVRLYEKTSWPVVSTIMALIAMPFAFRMGRRGALYGIAMALILGIIYWMVYAVFTKFGEVGNLPPLLSAWAANILFGLGAAYLFLHVET